MHERVVEAMKAARAGGSATGEFKGDAKKREMTVAYYYNDLLHHGRAGFLWQKLRDPRSYDYLKTETKGYDERLRMPKFPFNEEDIEAIETFVLGLVADPPAKEYIYRPEGPAKARIEGERMLDRFNCAGCHMLKMPEIRYGGARPNHGQRASAGRPAASPRAALASQAARGRSHRQNDGGEDVEGAANRSSPGVSRTDLQPARSGRSAGRPGVRLRSMGNNGCRRQGAIPRQPRAGQRPQLAPGATPRDGYAEPGAAARSRSGWWNAS